MKKGLKIAIAVGTGLAVGLGGWYVYQKIQKSKEAKRLAGLNEPNTTPKTDLGTPITTPVNQNMPSIKKGVLSLNPNATAQSLVSQPTESSFNAQDMVSRYQKPFWTVGG